ncbi:WD40 repeat-like protein [Mycena rosella]|uniref:WD40 repeat-like protein n=1 Tax=Mycena rosella TaxID=1033263 RepID=A0AAD7CVA9_MYCRO|nr:WD40 repeat-like protein [Mycena rosella]
MPESRRELGPLRQSIYCSGNRRRSRTIRVDSNCLGSALAAITSKLEILVRIGDEIATIHPYVNVAWKILTSVHKAVKKQKETDDQIIKLVETMAEVYSFVEEIDFLPQKIKSLEDKSLAIVKQTVECALFIQEYTVNGFCNRAIRNTWMQADRQIDELSETLLKLRASFDGRLKIQSLFMSTQVLEKVEALERSELLKTLNPVDMNATLRSLCLAGTRQDILDDITTWLAVPADAGNILWLSGVAGSGKSTISTTVSESFRTLDRLGAFLFFDRNNSSQSDPAAVIRTIAYSLAIFNRHIGSAISAVIQRDPAVVNAPLPTQFRELLLEPLQSAEIHIPGPILIILDALDECGNRDSRAALLSLLATELPKIPSLFRVLITSRRDPDIADKFHSRFAERQLDTGASSIEDVGVVIRHKMTQIGQDNNLGPTWPGDGHLQSLVHLSGGLFIWASTATRFIDGYQPDRRLKTLLAQDPTQGFNLDDLYSVALRNSGPWDEDSAFAHDARAVLACIVLGKVPMSDHTMDMILNPGEHNSRDVLKYLGCVVQWSLGKTARTLHASFADYLTDPTRSGGQPWSIDPKTDHHSLSLGCLRILCNELQFNICGLEDSHRRNIDVADIVQRVADRISPQLAYSSCFWFSHVQETPADRVITETITRFFYQHFLYWLEVLSFLKQILVATEALRGATHYAKERDEHLEDFIADATKFLAAFSPVIAQSAPHIYLSALPFAPRQSKIAHHFARGFPGTLQSQSPSGNEWPRIQKIIRCTGSITSVHYSPDGALVASGSWDKTICVWDAQTCALAAGPFEGHTDLVLSICFSPDGSRIASGSDDGTLRVWDSRTGTLVAGPFKTDPTASVACVHFSPDGCRIASGGVDTTINIRNAHTGILVAICKGHTDQVNSVHFSPDGTRIVSGSEDSTVRVWDAQTGRPIGGPLTDHSKSVRAVCFSPGGAHIASGSEDNTVCVWDAQAGTLLRQPLEGHTGPVYCVQFSPDGAWIASGSHDCTVRLWDVDTGEPIAGPFKGHTNIVVSVHFSPGGAWIASGSDDNTVRIWDVRPATVFTGDFHTDWVRDIDFSSDGAWIVSGSFDKTVRVWDSQTGALVAGPFEGHTKGVDSVQFSPDGAWIASGSSDDTVRIWDAQTGALIAGPCRGHSGSVNSVNFSPDGTRIAASSGDKTVRVWDSQTSDLVAGPFAGHTEWVSSVHFSHDGTRIASGSADNTVRVWDTLTGKLVAGPFEGHTDWVISVRFSPDGTLVASGSRDTTVRVWDVDTGALVAVPFQGHTKKVMSVDFSQDGTWIASASSDHTVRVWDARTGALVAGPFEGHTAQVTSVRFAPDGARMASGSVDTTVRVWEIIPSVSDPLGDYPRIDDGWVLNSAGELMFWVPPWLREGLYLPRNTLVICGQGTTKLDLSRFVHGAEWQKCIDPKFRDAKFKMN